MQPLNLPEDCHWRVIYVGKIQLHPSKKYYTFEVTFERLEIPQKGKGYSKKFKSSNSILREINLNLIKYFVIGSIWSNDVIVDLANDFETFEISNNEIDFRNYSFEIKAEDYLDKRFTPKKIDHEKEVSHSIIVIENKDRSNPNYNKTKSKTHSTLDASFIAIPSYEVIRFFLMGTGTYNSLLLQSNLFEKSENKIFDTEEVYFNEDTKRLFIKLKSGITQVNAITSADLCESELYRKEAQKLGIFPLEKISEFSNIRIPITKYTRITFKAKRVQNKNGEWGLFLLFFQQCIGHRNYKTVVFDHEDSFRKRNNIQSVKSNNSSEDSIFKIVNTGIPENFIEGENTNNSIPSIAIKSNTYMNDLLINSDDINVEKVIESNQNNRPSKTIKKPINTPDYGEKTEESASDNNIAPEDTKEKKYFTVYDPNAIRDESNDSPIYSKRFFQDFEKILHLMLKELEKKSTNVKVKFGNFSTKSNNEQLVFTLRANTLLMRSLLRGTSTSNSFLKLSKSKKDRKLYLIEVSIDSMMIYILEPEFKSETNTATTLIFHGKTFQKQSVDQLFQFFQKYVQNKGVKNKILRNNKISENYNITAFNHDLKKSNSTESMTVISALIKHSQKLSKAIISLSK